jgi:hypothetical protein
MTTLLDEPFKDPGRADRFTPETPNMLVMQSSFTCNTSPCHAEGDQMMARNSQPHDFLPKCTRPSLGDLMQRHKTRVEQFRRTGVLPVKLHHPKETAQKILKQPLEVPSVKIILQERSEAGKMSCNSSLGLINESLLGNTHERKRIVLKLRELLHLQYPDHQSTNPNAIFVKAKDCYKQTGQLPSKICGLKESLATVLTCVHYYAIFGGAGPNDRSSVVDQNN